MLSKLIKHEFKATSKLLLPLYLIVLVFTIMDRIVLNLDIFKGSLVLIPTTITIFYVISLIAIAAVTAVLMIIRFYKNLMTDEGYLMFTLPVKSYDLINSKLLVSTLWSIVSIAVIVCSLFLVFLTPENAKEIVTGFHQAMKELNTQFGSNTILLIIEFVFLILIGIIDNILLIYVSIALGQLFKGHRVLGSFVSYVGITTVLQIVTSVIMVIIGLFYNKFTQIDTIPKTIFPVSILLTIIMTAIFYIVTNYIFKRKLNLE